MKSRQRLRDAFEDQEVLKELEEWLNAIETRFAKQLLSAPDSDLLKAKHAYDAAKSFHRDFLTLFDKERQ